MRKIITFLMIASIAFFASGCTTLFQDKTDNEQLLNYFYMDRVDEPSYEEQELVIESLYNVDYDIIYDDGDYMGCYYIYLDEIHINENLPLEYFGITYAHELEHASGVEIEYYANYYAYITLWETNIDYFKYQVYLDIWYMVQGYYTAEYNCVDLLVQYYKNN